MIKIFAKHGTDEKVLIVCPREHAREVQLMLVERFGGNWVWIDKLDGKNEFLRFNDGLPYRGFHGKPERYAKGIEQANQITNK